MAEIISQRAVTSDDWARELTSIIDSNMEEVSELLTTKLSPNWPAEIPMPDFLGAQKAHKAYVTDASAWVFTTNDNYGDSKGARRQASKAASDSSVALGSGLRRLKRVVHDHFGEELVKRLGLAEQFEAKRNARLARGRYVLKQVRKHQEAVQVEGTAPLDLSVEADTLERQVTALKDALDTLDKRRQDTKSAMLALRRAVEAERNVAVSVAGCQEGWYRLVGYDGLADRIRPIIRKRSRRLTNDPTDAASTDDGTTANDASSEGKSLPVNPSDVIFV
jgi:hypothetical protein